MGNNNAVPSEQAEREDNGIPAVPVIKAPRVEGTEVSKQDLKPPRDEHKLAFVLYNIFTKEECEEWIKLTEDKGYEPALVNVGGGQQRLMTDVRNNMRCIIDDEVMANKLFERIRPYLPEKFAHCVIVSLNERLRFLRYDPGQKFEPHYDGRYTRDDGIERSYITVKLYLNEGFEGGGTTFLDRKAELPSLEYVPQTGSVLIFQHDILHEGSAVTKGRKYTMRTDVMYKPEENNK